jgi:hypothetical protein
VFSNLFNSSTKFPGFISTFLYKPHNFYFKFWRGKTEKMEKTEKASTRTVTNLLECLSDSEGDGGGEVYIRDKGPVAALGPETLSDL